LRYQAFIDDSYDSDGTFVLAGFIAPESHWAAFSKQWEKMLAHGILDKNGYYFKMAEMAWLPERRERVSGFFRVIEEHVTLGVSVVIDTQDLRAFRQKLESKGIPFGFDL